eukprot:6172651-Pleurochrysis_carterae.AAC.2
MARRKQSSRDAGAQLAAKPGSLRTRLEVAQPLLPICAAESMQRHISKEVGYTVQSPAAGSMHATRLALYVAHCASACVAMHAHLGVCT